MPSLRRTPALIVPRRKGSSPLSFVVPEVPGPSGLLLPTDPQPTWPSDPPSESRTAGGVIVPSPSPLPELFAEPGDLVLCAASPEALGLPELDLARVIAMVKDLPFEPTLRALAYLAAEVHHHSDDRERQLRLARELFDDQAYGALCRFVRSSATHLAFDPRYIASLQRLTILHAGPDPASGRGLTAKELKTIGLALLGMASALPADELGDREPQSSEEYDAWARYSARLSAWYHELDFAEALARAHSWFIDAHQSDELADRRGHCDIDRWLVDACGLSLAELLAGGLACAAVTHAFDDTATPRQRNTMVSPGFLRDGPLAEKEAALIGLISGTRSELLDITSDVGNDAERIAWDRSPFDLRPFLRRADGRLILISSRALMSWMTEGIYHRALTAARDRPHPVKTGKALSGELLSYVGTLAETATRRLVEGSHQRDVEAGTVRIHSEHLYRVRKGHTPMSPDIALSYDDDLVLIEVFSGHAGRDARSLLQPELMCKWLDNATTNKLVELAARTRDVLTGHLEYDGVDNSSVHVWPVLLLVGDPVFQSPALWRYLRDRAPQAFLADDRVMPTTLATLNDFEPLLALVQEDHHTLPELLTEFHQSRFSAVAPRAWVHARFKGIRRRPLYTEAQAETAYRLGALQLFPESKRLAEFRLHPDKDDRAA